MYNVKGISFLLVQVDLATFEKTLGFEHRFCHHMTPLEYIYNGSLLLLSSQASDEFAELQLSQV